MAPFARAALVFVQTLAHHLAFLPPNKTPEKGRYHTEESYVLQIAPAVFKYNSILLWCIAAFEVGFVLADWFGATFTPSPSLFMHQYTAICPATQSHMVTPLFVAGVTMTIAGMLIRLKCYQELGQLFTFDLSILPDHKLVKSGCYRYVRHPAYTGSLLIVAGLTFSQLTAGSLAVECSSLGPIGSLLLWVAWWTWSVAVATSRAIAEDNELQKLFGSEWDAYAATTQFWFVPGLW